MWIVHGHSLTVCCRYWELLQGYWDDVGTSTWSVVVDCLEVRHTSPPYGEMNISVTSPLVAIHSTTFTSCAHRSGRHDLHLGGLHPQRVQRLRVSGVGGRSWVDDDDEFGCRHPYRCLLQNLHHLEGRHVAWGKITVTQTYERLSPHCYIISKGMPTQHLTHTFVIYNRRRSSSWRNQRQSGVQRLKCCPNRSWTGTTTLSFLSTSRPSTPPPTSARPPSRSLASPPRTSRARPLVESSTTSALPSQPSKTTKCRSEWRHSDVRPTSLRWKTTAKYTCTLESLVSSANVLCLTALPSVHLWGHKYHQVVGVEQYWRHVRPFCRVSSLLLFVVLALDVTASLCFCDFVAKFEVSAIASVIRPGIQGQVTYVCYTI